MKCSNCGNNLSANAKFCPKCGYAASYAAGGKVCPNCGNNVSPDASFCNGCGISLIENISPEPTPQPTLHFDDIYPPQPTPKNKTGVAVFAVVIAVLFLVAVSGLGYLAYSAYSDGVFDRKTVSVDDDNQSDVDDSASKKDKSDKKTKKETKNVNPIDDSVIDNIISQNSSYTDFGIYVRNLENDYEYGYNQDDSFLASAMGQVVILNTISELVDEYNLNTSDEELHFTYLANGKEAPDSKYQNGNWLSLSDCIEDVAVYGDNNKSNLLVDFIGYCEGEESGFYAINKRLAANGYRNTKINRKTYINTALVDNSVPANTTTPYEIGNIFENLINNCNFGTKSYMTNIFKSLNPDGTPIGLKKYIPDSYTSCSANALTTASTNDVAIISDGKTEIVVAILSTTTDGKTNIEDNAARENVQHELLRYIIDTQF